MHPSGVADKSSRVNRNIIIGAVVGGLVALLVLVAIVVILIKKHMNSTDVVGGIANRQHNGGWSLNLGMATLLAD